MLFFNSKDLAQTYHISDRTVRNWIDAAKNGKLDLNLHEVDGKTYISNTSRNIAIIEKMITDRKKYRPRTTYKIVSPKPEFYELFNETQIYDIACGIEIHKEIPCQYSYFNGGAGYWDSYATRLATEETSNNLNVGLRLLESSLGYVDSLLDGYGKVNIVDIGVGNALPVRDLLKHLIEKRKLGRYVALDISPDIIKIAKTNIKTWFNDQVKFESYEIDINYDRFSHALAQEYLRDSEAVNLVLLQGGTLTNLREPDGALRVVHDSLSYNDIFVYTNKLDTESTRRFFDFNIGPCENGLDPMDKFLVSIVGIEDETYETELGYDEIKKERYKRIRFKMPVTIKFEFKGGERLINLNKNDAVLLWRAKQQSAMDVIQQFDRTGFYNLYSCQTPDEEYILTVSRIKRDSH